jgi:glucose/arabinose dehydrogenase
MPNSGRKTNSEQQATRYFKRTQALSLKKDQKSHPTKISLLITLGLLLTGCSLLPPSQPSPVAPAPTSIPANTPVPPEKTPTTPPLQQTATTLPSPTPTNLPKRVSTIPDAVDYSWQLYAGGFTQPIYLTHAGDDSGRVFIIEKPGRIWIMQNGQRLDTPFLDIRDIVGSQQFEQGLLSLAFHPDYTNNGFFFVYYTNRNGDTVTARYRVTEDPNIADPASREIIFQIEQPYANHNGGHLAFGPDGYLYISTGDGGSAGDPLGSGQDRLSFLGKILRLDIDGQFPYEIPPDNPFITFSSARGENWAYGLRNPWRYSFDRATGDMFIGDVGQNVWEEIDLLPAGTPGGNLGWDLFEGDHAFEGNPEQREGLIFPILEYQHIGGNCSVTGGYVYRGEQLPRWYGVYLFGDYCTGVIWGALPDEDGLWQAQQIFDLPVLLASFGEDQDGELYILDLNGGIYRLTEN